MCLEDIRLGRKTKTYQITVTIATTSTELLPPDDMRVAFTISAPVTNRITLSLADTAVLESGINVYPATQPVEKDIQKDGNLVTRKINAIANAAPETIGVWITRLETE